MTVRPHVTRPAPSHISAATGTLPAEGNIRGVGGGGSQAEDGGGFAAPIMLFLPPLLHQLFPTPIAVTDRFINASSLRSNERSEFLRVSV